MKKLIILIFMSNILFADIGQIAAMNGDVTINGKKANYKIKLNKNDFIKTGEKGKIQIKFSDGTIFSLGKNSTLDISEYLYDESKPKKNKAKFNVLKGAFSSITGRIGKLNKNKFKLNTKSASIGIRGTIVKANQEIIMCTEGAITVTTIKNGITINVEAGQKTNISTGVPSPAEEITNGEVESLELEIKESTEGNNLDILKEIKPEIIKEFNSVKTKDIILEGRTISTDGNQQYVTIEIDGLQNELTIDSSTGMTMTDDLGNAIRSSSRDVVWGHWIDDPNKKWVAGQLASEGILDSLRDASNTVNATYSGKVMGSVNGNDNIKMDSTNDVTINTTFGGGQNSVDGSINFETETNKVWNTTFEGTTSGNTFSSTSISGDSTSGSVDGAFYGTDATSIGGTFDLDNASGDKAIGVFKGTK